jgi:hypothetical protein
MSETMALLPPEAARVLLARMDGAENRSKAAGEPDGRRLLEFWYLNSLDRPTFEYVDRTYLLVCLQKSNLDDMVEKAAYAKWQSHKVEDGTLNYAWGACICRECRESVPEAAVKFIKTIFLAGGKLRNFDFKQFYVPIEAGDWEESPQAGDGYVELWDE